MITTRAIIDLPPSGEDPYSILGGQRLYNKAKIVLLVSNSTATVIIRRSPPEKMFPVDDPAPIVLTYSNLSESHLRANLSWLATNSFTDQRENKVVLTSQIDVGKFARWASTNASIAAKYPSGSGAHPNILYVADNRTRTTRQLTALRLVNGVAPPVNGGTGFTVATPNPLYIWGHYNCAQPAFLGSTNTSATVPCALVSDALTILSQNWKDSRSASNYRTRTPENTTVNAAILTGTVPSTGTSSTTFSGGVQNLPRLLEKWSTARPLTINGSLVNLFASQMATNRFKNPGAYYAEPTRQFSLDRNFADPTRLPPGTPLLNGYSPPMIITRPQSQTAPSGNAVTFTVKAIGTPPLGFQWRFNGTNISGATNYMADFATSKLTLTNVQVSQAGNYAVYVTNVFGSITSSNAVLTVIPPPMPPLNSSQPANTTATVTNVAGAVTSSNAIVSFYASAAATMRSAACTNDSRFRFEVNGVPGFNYTIEASTDLVKWVPLITNTSPFTFSDPDGGHWSQRFYRAALLP